MSDDFARFAYLALLLVAVGGFLLTEFRLRPGKTTRLALAWGLIFLGTIAAAGLWGDIRNTVSPQQRVGEGGRIEVPVGSDGHYHLTAALNGVDVRFVVDTGASTIALSPQDAEKIGINPEALAYTGLANTANGQVETAPVRIQTVDLGDFHDQNVQALVLRSDLNLSLMGMSYLSRFARVSIERDMLVLER